MGVYYFTNKNERLWAKQTKVQSSGQVISASFCWKKLTAKQQKPKRIDVKIFAFSAAG